MPFDEATLDAIKAAAGEPGAAGIHPNTAGESPAFFSMFYAATGERTERSYGATEGNALDNLLLVLQGKGDEVDKALRLVQAQRTEADAQTVLDAAVAERTAIESER